MVLSWVVGSSVNEGPLLGPQNSTAASIEGPQHRDPDLENYTLVPFLIL